jgi:uncharacterized protein YbjQ (UPF0145 family)
MKTPLPLFRIAHLLPLLGLSFVSGCGATALNPGAERVMVSHLPPRSDCRFVTTLVGQQGDAIAGKFTSNRDLAEGAMNDMKNQAQTAGANYVLLETTTAGNTMSGGPNYVSGQQTDVTHVGNAFICPNGPATSAMPRPESQASSQ